MTRQQVGQMNQQSKGQTPVVSGILQRAALRSVADKEVEPTEEVESGTPRESGFQHDFSQVPIHTDTSPVIQAKLKIGALRDKYEQEADAVAQTVVEQINAPATGEPVQRESESEGKERSHLLPPSPHAQISVSSLVMRQSPGGVGEGASVTQDVEQGIQQARGGGQSLDEGIREPMEQAFGADFSGVRVHTDDQSHKLNQSIQARAFTTGQDIFFRQGEFNPGHRSGQELIAHELTHVVQQNSSAVQRKPKLFTQVNKRSTQHGLQRQVAPRVAPPPTPRATRTIDGSAASISWIHPSSPAGSMSLVGVPDSPPPGTITESFVTGSSGFRFSNYLHAYVNTNDSRTISGSGLYPNSNIYTSPSQFGLPSQRFSTQRSQRTITNSSGLQGVEFQQLVGARTVSAGIAGGRVGAGVGAGVGIGAGIWGGAKAGAAIGTVFGPGIGTAIGTGIGAIGGGIAGYFAGSAVGTRTANAVTNFPPIWTETKLTLMADGTKDFRLLRHSLFPSNYFYSDLTQTSSYIALAAEQTAWENSGWGGGNPWGISRPTFTP